MRKLLVFIAALIVIGAIYILGIKTGQTILAPTAKTSLTKPDRTQEAVLVWANEAAVAVLSFDYAKYRAELQHASEYFTTEGWRAYLQAFKQSQDLNTVIKEKDVVTAVANGAPVIKSTEVIDGKFTWKVEIPILLTYDNALRTYQKKITVTILVQRTEPYMGKRGLGILSFVSV